MKKILSEPVRARKILNDRASTGTKWREEVKGRGFKLFFFVENPSPPTFLGFYPRIGSGNKTQFLPSGVFSSAFGEPEERYGEFFYLFPKGLDVGLEFCEIDRPKGRAIS